MGIQGKDLDAEGYWFYSLWTHGGAIFGPDGKSGFASPEAVAATDNYIRFIKANVTQPGVTGSSREDLQNLFAAGKLGMVLSGPWFNAQLAEQGKGVDYGITTIPVATTAATYGVTDTIAILESSNLKPSGNEVSGVHLQQGKQTRVRQARGLRAGPESRNRPSPSSPRIPKMKVFLEMGSMAKFAPLFPAWEEMSDGLKTELSSDLLRAKSPGGGLKQAADGWTRLSGRRSEVKSSLAAMILRQVA
jgi:multiple sugar transport system substrate-binding protein